MCSSAVLVLGLLRSGESRVVKQFERGFFSASAGADQQTREPGTELIVPVAEPACRR